MSVDVIEYGPERTRETLGSRTSSWAHRHRLPLIGVALVVLLLAAADQWQRQREFTALLDQVTASELAIADTEARIDGTLAYWSPVLNGSGYTPAVRQSFADDLAEVGQAGAVLISDQARTLSDTTLLPWHSTGLEARAAYAERLRLWDVHLAAIATDPDALFRTKDDLEQSAVRASATLAAAVPWSGGSTELDRIREAFPVAALRVSRPASS